MRDHVIQTASLTKSYKQGNALERLSITVHSGDIYGLIGKNGAGKTTLMRILTGLIHPTDGDIWLFGNNDPNAINKARKRLGCIIEAPAFFPRMTARQNLEYYRIQRGIPSPSSIDSALEFVNLSDTGKKPFNRFSMGMKQRLGIALAIMGKPDVLILDEPINGLDPTGITEFRNIIQTLHSQYNMTILISSHILTELSQIATQYGVIHQGRMMREFSNEELLESTKRAIAIKTNDPSAAAVVLEEKLHTRNFEALPNNVIAVYDFIDMPSHITSALAGEGILIESVQEQGANLEQFFFDIIGERVGGVI